MTAHVRDTNWIKDKHLENTLRALVGDNSNWTEVLDYMKSDFLEYPWSQRTLDRRVRYFNIYKTDKSISVEDVQRVVIEQISGPGRPLGYRAMHAKIWQYNQLNVPRALVYLLLKMSPYCLEYIYLLGKKIGKKELLHLKGPIRCFFLMVILRLAELYLSDCNIRVFRYSY